MYPKTAPRAAHLRDSWPARDGSLDALAAHMQALSKSSLEHVTGGFPGQSFLGKAAKKLPGIGTVINGVQAAKSGLAASRSYTAEERAHGFSPSGAQQFGAGALNAASTFIDS